MAIYKVIGKSISKYLKYHDESSRYDVLHYILNGEKIPDQRVGGYGVELRNYQGQIDVPYAALQMETVANCFMNNHGVKLRHSIISFDERENIHLDAAEYIAQKFCAYFFYQGYQIMYAVHQNKSTLHIHFMMNTVNFDSGRKYEGSRKQHYDTAAYMTDVCNLMRITLFYCKDEF